MKSIVLHVKRSSSVSYNLKFAINIRSLIQNQKPEMQKDGGNLTRKSSPPHSLHCRITEWFSIKIGRSIFALDISSMFTSRRVIFISKYQDKTIFEIFVRGGFKNIRKLSFIFALIS